MVISFSCKCSNLQYLFLANRWLKNYRKMVQTFWISELSVIELVNNLSSERSYYLYTLSRMNSIEIQAWINFSTSLYSSITLYMTPVYLLGVSRGFGFLEFKSVSNAQDWMDRHRVYIHVVFVWFGGRISCTVKSVLSGHPWTLTSVQLMQNVRF